jgi:hypothetical protein
MVSDAATPSSMQKKIPVTALRVGMHLLRLEGPWIDHPFWRTRFVIDDPDTLVQVQRSGVRECWIDTDRGLDVAPVLPATRPAELEPALPAAAAPAARARPAVQSFEAELREAAAVCSRGRRAVVAMFQEARMGRTLDAEACLPLVEEIAGSVMRNPGALVSLARLKSAARPARPGCCTTSARR